MMTPYYERANAIIYHGDCRDLLPQLEPVDLIVTDVAYETISGGSNTGRLKGRPVGILAKNNGKVFDHNDIKPTEYANLFYAVLKDPAHCYIMINNLNIEDALREFRLAGFGLHNILPWIKNNATPNRWYMKDVELILFFRKGAAFPINNPGDKASCPYPNLNGKIHETEKPVPLMHKLIKNSSQPGQVVLDPFCGSGTTLEAALQLDRQAIGIDIDEAKCEVAAKRLISFDRYGTARETLTKPDQMMLFASVAEVAK